MSDSEELEREVVRRSGVAAKYALTDQVIYRGLASTIFQAVERGTLLQVGVKVLMKHKFDSEAERKNAIAEVEIHSSLPPHANVVRLLASEDTPDAILLVTPYTPHGDLWELIKYGQTYCEKEVRNCAGQIFDALRHIHAVCGLVHGDIKPQNFLLYRVHKRHCVQICDFGLAERPCHPEGMIQFHGIRGTSGWFAPEMLDRCDYSGLMDLFAVGLILFRMLGGYAPFEPPSRFGDGAEFDDRCWCHISSACRHFVGKLLALEPSLRGTSVEACEHEWLTCPEILEPTEEQLAIVATCGPPPCRDVCFWPAGSIPEPHLRNSYADLQSLVANADMDIDEDASSMRS